MGQNNNKQSTLKTAGYAAPGTYLAYFKNELFNSTIPQILAITLIAPIERWRIIAQTQAIYPTRPNKIKNFLSFLMKMPKQQGLSSLWRGNLPCLYIYFCQIFAQIAIFDSLKQRHIELHQSLSNKVPQISPIFDKFVLPLYSTVTALAIIHPLDTYRVHKSMDYYKFKKQANFNGFWDRVGQIGIKNMYRGFFLANFIAIINFNFYSNVNEVAKNLKIDSPISSIVTPELCLSALATAIVHPFDTLKKIYQLNNLHKPQIFSTYTELLQYIQANTNSNILYKGFLASISRTALFIPLYFQLSNIWTNNVLNKTAQNCL